MSLVRPTRVMRADGSEPTLVVGPDLTVEAANDACRRLFPTLDSGVAQHCYEVLHGGSRPCFEHGAACPVLEAISTGGSEWALHHSCNGRGRFHEVEVQRVRTRGGRGARIRILDLRDDPGELGVVGNSPTFQKVLRRVREVAADDRSVVFQGPPGSGKAELARWLHRRSPRHDRPLVVIDCAALRPDTWRRELFGHRGEHRSDPRLGTPGLLDLARGGTRGGTHRGSPGGTLLLLEVPSLPPAAQRALAGLLERDRRERRGESPRLDLRPLSTASEDLLHLISTARLRVDLARNLCDLLVRVPSLSQRRGDLRDLARTHLVGLGLDPSLPALDDAALRHLERCDLRGNLRQLETLLEGAWVRAGGGTVRLRHLLAVEAAG